MTTVERLKALLKERKIAVSTLEKACGMSNAYISQLKKGSIPADRLFVIADYLHVSPRWLVFGSDDAEYKSEIEKGYESLDRHGRQVVDAVLSAEIERCEQNRAEVEKVTYIRHYLSSPAAGVNGLVSGEDYEDIPLPPDAPKGADYCLTVSGDSMEPFIRDGDMVYVKADDPIHDFDVGVFCVDGCTYVKQLCRGYDGTVYLLSANPLREDSNITVHRDSTSSLVCFGRVMLQRKLPQPEYN